MSWAITGTGMVSSLGADATASLDAFARGETSIAPLRAFDATLYRTGHAYELDQEGAHTQWRTGRWLCDSISQALAQAALAPSGELRVPVLVGTGLGEQRSLELALSGQPRVTVDQLEFTRVVREATGLPKTVTVVNACSASLFTLAMATDLLRLDEADAVVVAGSDSISECMFGLLDRVNGEPPTRVRPFDRDRLGVILGEGAAAVVVEPFERAIARGATPLATLRGVGTTCDAYHVTAPQRDGIVAAMRSALSRAGVTASDVDLIFAHGTGTQLNDATEAEAIRELFAGTRRKPLITALKSLIGHTSGASGLMSLVAAVEALATGRVPPTRHHETPIEAIEGFPIVTEPTRRPDLRVAQVNAFGFGGVNAVAVVSGAADRACGSPPAGVNEVVVTGVGIEIPGIASLADLVTEVGAGRPSPIAGFDPAATLGRRGLRYKDRASLMALCAADHALRDGRLLPVVEPESIGVVVSTQLALVETVGRVIGTIHKEGAIRCSPMDLPNASGNVAAAQIAIWFQLKGLNLTISAGPTSGIDALHQASVAIRAGRAARMLVVGVETAEPAATDLMAYTASRHGDDPDRVRCFDGAAAVVLESGEAARARGARILARVGDPAGPELRFEPCERHTPGARAAEGAVVLSRTVGEASAALGVLQCAVAVARLAEGGPEGALLTAGGCWGGPHASLGLEAAR